MRDVCRVSVIAAAVLLATLTACTFDKTTAPVRLATPVVHSVINPAKGELIILLERTLTGRINVDRHATFNPYDPIVSAAGDPIDSAIVILENELGDTVLATENSPGWGRGVYNILNKRKIDCIGSPLKCMSLLVNSTYRLHIRTKQGEALEAVTTVPDVEHPTVGILPLQLNRDRDTLKVEWTPVRGAVRYRIHIETPFGPLTFFTDTAHVAITNRLRNIDREGFPPVLVPGFYQNISVLAVDQNYFDYERSDNNPFTGVGLITHVVGGSGVFGSVAPVYDQRYDVTADLHEPIEGSYRMEGTTRTLRLYVESHAGDLTHLSGWHSTPIEHAGILGSLRGTDIRLAMLLGQFASDTIEVLAGTATADSLVLASTGLMERQIWRKVP